MPSTLRAATFLDKGGTGKTTTVAHLGVALSRAGHEVLLIDLAGKQADLAKNFGLWDEYEERIEAEDDWPIVSTVFREEWSRIAGKLGDDAVDELILETDEGPDLIPTHPGLDGLETELNDIEDTHERYSRLDEFLNEYVEPLDYDVVLLDLPGSTNNVSYNGLWAARNVVVPVEAGPFEARQAEQLRDDLSRISEGFGVELQLAMLILNKMDARTRLSDDFLDEFEEKYPNTLAPRHVPRSQEIRNAAVEGKTLFSHPGSSETAERARDAFEENAEALVERLERRKEREVEADGGDGG
ncbi:MAG: ParA family protein [Halobacteria archaeon]|nr:ParA family protein [Halobacteria archaeon]